MKLASRTEVQPVLCKERTMTHMKKYLIDFLVKEAEHPRPGYVLLKLTPQDGSSLPPMKAGQFVEVQVPPAARKLLRRPISINYVDYGHDLLWLLIHTVGEGTLALERLRAGDTLNCLLPLGNGFSLPAESGKKMLLIGGGVGTAPLLYLGEKLREAGCEPVFLLGGRTASDIMQTELFERLGRTFVTTEDGSGGERGFVTNHSILRQERFDGVATCGPKPMMVAVARWAESTGTDCEASLENLMACGLGACLCCVEKMADGHNLCVCQDGPIFNTQHLSWLNSK